MSGYIEKSDGQRSLKVISPETRLARYDGGVDDLYNTAESLGLSLPHYDGAVRGQLTPIRDGILRGADEVLNLPEEQRADALQRMAIVEINSFRWGLKILDPLLDGNSRPEDLGQSSMNVANRVLRACNDFQRGHDVAGHGFFCGQEEDTDMVARLMAPYLNGLRLLMLSRGLVGTGDGLMADSSLLQKKSEKLIRRVNVGKIISSQVEVNSLMKGIREREKTRLTDTAGVLGIIGRFGKEADIGDMEKQLRQMQERGSDTTEIARLQSERYKHVKTQLAQASQLADGIGTGVRADVLAQIAIETEKMAILFREVGQRSIDIAVLDQANAALERILEAGDAVVTDLIERRKK